MSSAAAPAPAKYEPPPGSDPTWDRLEDQIRWYDRKSIQYQTIYKQLKLTEIIAAAAIPFLSALNISFGGQNQPDHTLSWIILGFGVLITVLEGVLQLYQYQQSWVAYRSACESLKHERYMYLAKAGPYQEGKTPPDPHALLAERVEGLISQEHAKWIQVQQQEHKIKSDEHAGQPKHEGHH